jgi:hypothetical protein
MAAPLQRSLRPNSAFGAVRPRKATLTIIAAVPRPQDAHQPSIQRRSILLAAPAAAAVLLQAARPAPAAAFVPPPPGFRYHQDKLDGYSFIYPDVWIPVTTSGNDVFYRNPFDAEQNLFVDISSPSSSKFASVEDLGTPADAAKKILDQYMDEYMSTRIGVRHNGEVVLAEARREGDALYYDIAVRFTSRASRNQLAVTQEEVEEGMITEWDRRYVTVLGVANKRLYQLRLQTAWATYDSQKVRLRFILV